MRRRWLEWACWCWVLARFGRSEYESGLRVGKIIGQADLLSKLLARPDTPIGRRATAYAEQLLDEDAAA